MIDYEKLYKEALERAKRRYEAGLMEKEEIEFIFPELAESEDERIRKELISMVNLALQDGRALCPGGSITKEQSLAWLEKHREGNLVEKKYVQECYNKGLEAGRMQKPKVKSPLSPHEISEATQYGIIEGRRDVIDNPERFGLQKPAEWSEEDKKLLDSWLDVIDRNDWRMDEKFCKALREFINRLKSLRPQPKAKLPMWKKVSAEYTYPLCITQEMDVNGDYQYCLSSGKIYDGCEYISVAELSQLPREE